MAVVSFHSAKGGVGKTTLSINVAAELARRGIATVVLDADQNQHASRFGEVYCSVHPDQPLKFVSLQDKSNLMSAIREAEAEADIVLIDLPAGTSELSFRALLRSHLVLIPTQNTILDLRDAGRTAEHIADAEETSGSPIHSAVIWTRRTARFESKTEKNVRDGFLDTLVQPDKSFFRNAMMENDAFRAGLVHSWAPYEYAESVGKEVTRLDSQGNPLKIMVPKGTANAATNISEIVSEIIERLQNIGNTDPGSPDGRVLLKKNWSPS